MTKKNITIAALAAVLVMAMSAVSFAGPGYGRGCDGSGPGVGYSQLTPEKQAAVDKIVDSYSKQFTELRDQMWTKRATLEAMVNGGNADEKKIGSLVSDISGLRTKMRDLRDKMSDELEAETGIAGFARGASCPGFGPGGERGEGRYQQQGRGMGYGPGMM